MPVTRRTLSPEALALGGRELEVGQVPAPWRMVPASAAVQSLLMLSPLLGPLSLFASRAPTHPAKPHLNVTPDKNSWILVGQLDCVVPWAVTASGMTLSPWTVFFFFCHLPFSWDPKLHLTFLQLLFLDRACPRGHTLFNVYWLSGRMNE